MHRPSAVLPTGKVQNPEEAPPAGGSPSRLSSFLDVPYVVLPDEDEEERAPVHLPVLLDELQCVL